MKYVTEKLKWGCVVVKLSTVCLHTANASDAGGRRALDSRHGEAEIASGGAGNALFIYILNRNNWDKYTSILFNINIYV